MSVEPDWLFVRQLIAVVQGLKDEFRELRNKYDDPDYVCSDLECRRMLTLEEFIESLGVFSANY